MTNEKFSSRQIHSSFREKFQVIGVTAPMRHLTPSLHCKKKKRQMFRTHWLIILYKSKKNPCVQFLVLLINICLGLHAFHCMTAQRRTVGLSCASPGQFFASCLCVWFSTALSILEKLF